MIKWIKQFFAAPPTQKEAERRIQQEKAAAASEPKYWKSHLPSMNRLEHDNDQIKKVAELIDKAILSAGGEDSAWHTQKCIEEVEMEMLSLPENSEGDEWKLKFEKQLQAINWVLDESCRGDNGPRLYGPGQTKDGEGYDDP